jgi:hypothetical protein
MSRRHSLEYPCCRSIGGHEAWCDNAPSAADRIADATARALAREAEERAWRRTWGLL